MLSKFTSLLTLLAFQALPVPVRRQLGVKQFSLSPHTPGIIFSPRQYLYEDNMAFYMVLDVSLSPQSPGISALASTSMEPTWY